jgi:nitrile hydratase
MRYSVGEHVRTRVMNPDGHTRLPGYLRGRRGEIEKITGVYPLSDARAKGVKRDEAVYTVLFRAPDIWGSDADPGGTITADLFESYLEPDR